MLFDFLFHQKEINFLLSLQMVIPVVPTILQGKITETPTSYTVIRERDAGVSAVNINGEVITVKISTANWEVGWVLRRLHEIKADIKCVTYSMHGSRMCIETKNVFTVEFIRKLAKFWNIL